MRFRANSVAHHPATAFVRSGSSAGAEATQLADAVDLIAHADAAVTNDSGLMHIAAAVGTRVIAIYGSSSPEFTPPLTNDAVVNWLQLDCSPCFQRHCKFGHYNCLNQISAASIFEQLEVNSGL